MASSAQPSTHAEVGWPRHLPTCDGDAVTPIERYRRVLRVPAVRHALFLGLFVRMPIFAGSVVLTLHVVSTLDRSYGAAGLVSGAATIAIAVSGPWRGRLLDRLGLRRVVAPSVLVALVCWSIAPFAPYLGLLLLAALAGLFVVPSFAVVRQVLISAVPESDRRTVIALDGVFVELAFMIGPAVGVAMATRWPTSWVVFGIEMAGAVAGAALWVVNPPLKAVPRPQPLPAEPAPGVVGVRPTGVAADADHLHRAHDVEEVSFRSWFRPAFVSVCLVAAATTVVLGGSDLAIVAALREFGDPGAIGWVLALWGLGSLVGGLVYGGLSRSISPYLLLAALGAVTIPMALADGALSLALLSVVAGVLCAPTITATVDAASRLVPEARRGEAMGWHGSFMTAGIALGAPAAGLVIDQWGFSGGFVAVGVVGILVAGLGLAVRRVVRGHRGRRAALPMVGTPTLP